MFVNKFCSSIFYKNIQEFLSDITYKNMILLKLINLNDLKKYIIIKKLKLKLYNSYFSINQLL